MAEWFKALDLKSDMSQGIMGSNPISSLIFIFFFKYVTNHFTFTIVGIF